jgi:hypothetical protein
METTEMRERSAVLWSEGEKTPAREARLVRAATPDPQVGGYDYVSAVTSRMQFASLRPSVGAVARGAPTILIALYASRRARAAFPRSDFDDHSTTSR